jgi:hypothetical protein
MIIKLDGIEFDAVNVGREDKKEMSIHIMNAGNVKTQEAPEIRGIFAITFIRLFSDDVTNLRGLFAKSAPVTLLLDTEDYLISHNVKLLDALRFKLSQRYPGCYESDIECVEVK